MSTALYRRYRPETFADVIGQEHVTDPLRAALDADRVTHAYLFSGPRGCGKTTSARIFARCLNCAEGPTSTPCGTCDSCVDLARGGSGSLDVVEMDAASHGGVDDARDLRERAVFSPARDRYKVFIIDEAHMVSNQGFNALLKLVEEPPEHVKFVFATTEPEKVIGTIRSRTHHYPFRLVAPQRLQQYLEELCTAESISVDGGVLPLVIRAGGGSVRDTLSVLDQLMAGAEQGSVSYERAVGLLGYTPATLLDDVVDALAARDGASVFKVIDRVIDSGHDPRRFAEDLLERLRDLVVIAVAGAQAESVMRALPADQVERMQLQAQHLGPAQLSRSADLVHSALTEMAGATSPRLQLELLGARLLLPGADDDARSLWARLDAVERRLAHGGVPAAASHGGVAEPPETSSRPAQPPAPAAPVATDGDARTEVRGQDPGRRTAAESERSSSASGSGASDRPGRPPVPDAAPSSAPAQTAPPAASTASGPAAPDSGGAPGASSGTGGGSADSDTVRRRWQEVLATLARIKRATWALVSQNAQVAEVSDGVVKLSFTTPGLATAFRSGPHSQAVQQALAETLGVTARVEPVLADDAAAPPPASRPHAGLAWGSSGPVDSAAAAASVGSVDTAPDSPSAGVRADTGTQAEPPRARARDPRAGASAPSPPPADEIPPAEPPDSYDAPDPGPGPGAGHRSGRPASTASSATSSASSSGDSTPPPAPGPDRTASAGTASAPSPAGGEGARASTPTSAASQRPIRDVSAATTTRSAAPVDPEDDVASLDDPDADDSGLAGEELIARMLGGTIIEQEGGDSAP